MPRNASPDKTVGFGWVGRWDFAAKGAQGDIGWVVPGFVLGYSGVIESPPPHSFVPPDHPFTKCRITIEVVKDSRGRPITRKASTIGACKESK